VTGSSAPDVLNGNDGNDTLRGGDAADTLNGGNGDDQLYGENGVDVINGGDGNDFLDGGANTDTLNGGNGNDILIGGAGWDRMTGGAGSDTFRWFLADKGVAAGIAENPQAATTPAQFNGVTSAGSRAQDYITDFDAKSVANGGDVLDLKDLLQGEHSGTAGSLEKYLDFSVVGTDTLIRISSSGGFTGGTYNSAVEDERIVLQNIDLRTAMGLTTAATDAQIIAELLNRSKLVVDP